MQLLPGDVLVLRGHSLLSRIIRLLISIVKSIPFAACKSHVCEMYSTTEAISAESSGVKLTPLSVQLKKADVWVYRDISQLDLPITEGMHYYDNLNDTHLAFLSKHMRYGWPIYGLRFNRIASFFAAMFCLLSLPIGFFTWLPMIVSGSVLVGLLVWKQFLLHAAVGARDCSPLEAEILAARGLIDIDAYGKSRAIHPNDIEFVLQTLLLHGVVKLVGYKPAGEDWIVNKTEVE